MTSGAMKTATACRNGLQRIHGEDHHWESIAAED